MRFRAILAFSVVITAAPILAAESTEKKGSDWILVPGFKPSIYFATDGEGLKSYSLQNSQLNTITSAIGSVWIVAYNSIAAKIYFSRKSTIYRIDLDGNKLENLWNTTETRKMIHRIFIIGCSWEQFS